MSRITPTPAMPHGVHYDADETILTNAGAAWEAEKQLLRSQRERNARTLARRVFRTDDVSFEYQPTIGLDIPSFVIEGELIAFGANGFGLIEFCSDCGEDADWRLFGSLASLGRVIEERDAAGAYVCRVCQISRNVAASPKGKS